MPKITMREGEHLFIEFYRRNGKRLPESLLVEWTGQQAIVRVVTLDEKTGRPGCVDTIFEVTVDEPEPDPTTREFINMLTEVFGSGQVFVMDEHGIRPAKPGKQN